MVDIGRNNGAATGDFVADEFGGDEIGNGGTEAVAVHQSGAAKIFARRDEFHFLGDEALAGIVQLADILARLGAQKLDAFAGELRHGQEFAFAQAIIFGLAGAAFIFFDIAAGENPFAAAGGQALLDVNRHGIIRVRT